ncbi:flavin reductase family protein [Aspergillus alliaceus]|uniref:flavin reductase family protein n=1 Tax=Petromyces alliaceus TaxID=209559 RepID=UPI0012A493F7|nr:uncharacterized protein BDW43DRAFT_297748 [Aspergillus alliaceus]KAB8237443.1 hypothetical protein BDW43DRAFT_297748 [Aspergillus alliaceus]
MPAPAAATECEQSTGQKNCKIVQEVVGPRQAHRNHQIPYPTWDYGQGVPDNGASLAHDHHEIDPYAPDRTVNGKGEKNLSPVSYFQDTYRNLKEKGKCVINTVSEEMIEAVNAAATDAPHGVSEWDVSGLHEAPSTTVRPSRVKESVVNIKGKVIDIKEFVDHQQPGMSIAATGAANEGFSHIDIEKLRPSVSTFERPRRKWSNEVPKSTLSGRLHGEKEGEN